MADIPGVDLDHLGRTTEKRDALLKEVGRIKDTPWAPSVQTGGVTKEV